MGEPMAWVLFVGSGGAKIMGVGSQHVKDFGS